MNVVRMDARLPAGGEPAGADASFPAGERARLLMREARSAAIEHLGMLEAAIETVRELSLEVLQGGEAYDAGARDLAARLAEDLLWRGKRLALLAGRARAGLPAY